MEEHSSCRKHRIDRISTKARHDGGHDGFFMYRVSVAIFALAWISESVDHSFGGNDTAPLISLTCQTSTITGWLK